MFLHDDLLFKLHSSLFTKSERLSMLHFDSMVTSVGAVYFHQELIVTERYDPIEFICDLPWSVADD